MTENPTHEMTLMAVDAGGVERWDCPTCGRVIRIAWEPFRRLVVEEGDPWATHSCSKGGLQMGALSVRQPLQGSADDLAAGFFGRG